MFDVTWQKNYLLYTSCEKFALILWSSMNCLVLKWFFFTNKIKWFLLLLEVSQFTSLFWACVLYCLRYLYYDIVMAYVHTHTYGIKVAGDDCFWTIQSWSLGNEGRKADSRFDDTTSCAYAYVRVCVSINQSGKAIAFESIQTKYKNHRQHYEKFEIQWPMQDCTHQVKRIIHNVHPITRTLCKYRTS